MIQPLEFLLAPERAPAATFAAVLLLALFAVCNLMVHLSVSRTSRVSFLAGGLILALSAAIVQFVPFSTGVERVSISPGRVDIYKFNGGKIMLESNNIAEVEFLGGALVFSLTNGERVTTQYIPVTQRGGIMQALSDVLFSDADGSPKLLPQEKRRFSDSTILAL